MISEHEKIERLLKNRIQDLKENKTKNCKDNNNNIDEIDKEIEKFNKLYRLILNPYQPFFEKISIGVALRILEDIGIPESELMETYKKLIKEELKKNYTLIDINLDDNKEER